MDKQHPVISKHRSLKYYTADIVERRYKELKKSMASDKSCSLVIPQGFKPWTSALQRRRSNQLS